MSTLQDTDQAEPTVQILSWTPLLFRKRVTLIGIIEALVDGQPRILFLRGRRYGGPTTVTSRPHKTPRRCDAVCGSAWIALFHWCKDWPQKTFAAFPTQPPLLAPGQTYAVSWYLCPICGREHGHSVSENKKPSFRVPHCAVSLPLNQVDYVVQPHDENGRLEKASAAFTIFRKSNGQFARERTDPDWVLLALYCNPWHEGRRPTRSLTRASRRSHHD